MELTQLSYFSQVAHCENISRVAEQNYMAAPTLSKTISRLEQELNVRLFDRLGNRIKLTMVGSEFLVHVDRILNEVDLAKRKVDALRGNGYQDIFITLPHAGLINAIKVNFLSEYPKIALQQFVQSADQAKDLLLAHRMDLALSFVPIIDEAIEWTSLGKHGTLVLISEKHPLYQQETINLKDLVNDNFILNNTNPDLNHIFTKFFHHAGFKPKIMFAGDEPKLITSLVQENRAVFLLPEVLYSTDLAFKNPFGEKQTRRCIPISSPDCQIEFGVARLKNEKLIEPAEYFYQYLCRRMLSDGQTDTNPQPSPEAGI